MRTTDYTDCNHRLHRYSKKIAFGNDLMQFSQWYPVYTFLYHGKKTCLFIFLAIFLISSVSFAFGQEEIPAYEDKGKRDPFLPLVDKNGQYLLDEDIAYSFGELSLSGILWDPQGKSTCLINNQIVKIGEVICGFKIDNITKDSVIISKGSQEFILRLIEEGEE